MNMYYKKQYSLKRKSLFTFAYYILSLFYQIKFK